MTDFKRRIEKVRGWQLVPGAIVPDWLKADDQAFQIKVYDRNSDAHYAVLGDWIIKLPDGSFETRTAEEFHEEFEPDEMNWR